MKSDIRPTFPTFIEASHSKAEILIAGFVFLTIIVLVSICIGRFAAHKWGGNKSKTTVGFVLLSLVVGIALFCFFGLSARAIQGMIFSHILLISSYSDLKLRECDDYLSVMILLAAFIGIEITAIPGMFIAAMFTAGIFLLVVITISDGIGGADIKLASASVFLLGFQRGIIGLIVGLLIAITVNSIKSKKSGFPMIPYLTAGFIPAFFIGGF